MNPINRGGAVRNGVGSARQQQAWADTIRNDQKTRSRNPTCVPPQLGVW